MSIDYVVYDGSHARVWIPVADTASVDVFDAATSAFTRVDGFKTAAREVRGTKRMMGPSAATIGDAVAYIGNRATNEVCVVEQEGLKLGACLTLPVPTDGVTYVASTKEVWVTTPRDRSLTILDAATRGALRPKLVIKTDGQPEGYAVDAKRGLFFTNLEDKNLTLVVDIGAHRVKTSWIVSCGAEGPRGLAVDTSRDFVFVACTDSVLVLDGGHGGAPLAKLDTGGGVDNIDYVEASKLLVVAAGKVARLTVARIDERGQPTIVASATTAEGARNAVADANGNVYVADSRGARLLVFAANVPR